MKRKKLFVISAIMFFIVGLSIFTVVYFNIQRPNITSAGVVGKKYITKAPVVIQESDGTVKINWSLSKKCEGNSVEVQEKNYKPNTDSFWGGDEAVCDESSGTHQCEAILPPEGLKSGKVYLARIQTVFCENDVSISGPVFSFTKK